MGLIVALVASVMTPIRVLAANTVTYGGSNVTGLIEATIPITGVSVTYDEPTVPVTLSVERGVLSMTTDYGLTFTTGQTGSNISFSGSVTNVNAALATLRYRTIDTVTVTLTVSLSAAGDVYFPGNGHMYEVVDAGSGISWEDAKSAAEARTKNGAAGYLATVTSQSENDYIAPRLSGSGWFGASDSVTEGDWKWVTGPEVGTSFWAGLGNGSTVNDQFAGWAGGEPNNAGNEDCAQFYAGNSGWNDLPCGPGFTLSYYVVEYGADGDLPAAPESTTVTITTSRPAANIIPISNCTDLIDVQDNGTENRYDDLRLTANIDCTGEVIEPMFAQEDSDFGYIGFRGTFNGQGFSMTNVTINKPSDSNVGLFAHSNGATFQNMSIDATVNGLSCVGGLVGNATDTTFDSVSTSGSVVSTNSSAGGIVGCYSAALGSSEVTNSSSESDVSTQSNAGGIIGDMSVRNAADLTIRNNTYSGYIRIYTDI